ncbi:MAG: glycosyltransferase [Planctomycetes bacterium]|nr:glycosyltransferase [Planctomycetota bacterium]
MLSVIIPVYDGAATLEPLLAALRAQELCSPGGEAREWGGPSLGEPLEIVVPLTPSRDASREVAERYGARVLEVLPGEFDHGETRNRAALASRGEFLVFLSQDTLPVDRDFLWQLVAPLADPAVFGVTGRMLPREGASAPTLRSLFEETASQEHARRIAIEDFEAYRGLHASERRALYVYNNVCGAMPRRVWERLPFPRARFGEDLRWARRALEAGGALVYEPRARVVHSHEPNRREAYARAWEDARLLAEELGRPPLRTLREALLWALRERRADARYRRIYAPTARRGALGRRFVEALGAWRGARAARGSGRASEELPLRFAPAKLRILHVVHGFPPESRAGTELACLALARAQRAAGHEVAIFARSETAARPEFEVWREDWEELPVWRMAHRLQYAGGIADTYRLKAVDRAFQAVLGHVGPDVVHFQHLLHLSTTLVPIASRAGAATVATLHDYWPICPRVQLLRPDGRRCGGSQRLGCYLCVKNRWLPLVGLARRASALLERSLPRLLERSPLLRSRERMAKDLRALYRRSRAMRRTFAGVDWILSPSRYLKRVVGGERGWEAEAIRVVENGLDAPERFAGVRVGARSGGPLRIGFLGSLVEHKGPAQLVRAARGLAVELHLHGRFEPERFAFPAALARDAAGSAARFHGAYDGAQLPEILRSLDLVAMPSLWAENSPVVLQECAAAGVPVLVPRLGGFVEKVREGRDGWFFRAGSVRSLRQALAARIAELENGVLLRGTPRAVASAEDQARWLEVGYRAAWLQRRAESSSRVLFERWGRDMDEVLGEHEVQGRDYLLLRPAHAGACVYAWDYPRELRDEIERGEPAELELELMLFGGEGLVPVGGAVFFNGTLCGEIDPQIAGERDQIRSFRFPIALNGGRNALRIENSVRGQRYFTRIRRVRVVQKAQP